MDPNELNYSAAGALIYDGTADLHRAIAYADAYLGDESSLAELFKVSGKPRIVQNVSLINYKHTGVFYRGLCSDGQDVWLFLYYSSSALKLVGGNVDKPEAVSITETTVPFSNQFSTAARIQNCVLFFSVRNNKIVVLNESTGERSVLSVDEKYLTYASHADGTVSTVRTMGSGVTVIDFHGKLYCFAPYVKCVFVIDVSDMTLSYYPRPLEMFGATADSGNVGPCYHGVYYSEEKEEVVVTRSDSNLVVSFNLNTTNHSVHAVENKKPTAGFSHIGEFEGHYYLFPKMGHSIVRWNRESGKTDRIMLTHNEFNEKTELSFVVNCDNCFLIVSGGSVYTFTPGDASVTEMTFTERSEQLRGFQSVCRLGDTVYMIKPNDSSVYTHVLGTGTVGVDIPALDERAVHDILEHEMSSAETGGISDALNENAGLGDSMTLLNKLIDKNAAVVTPRDRAANNGKSIYEYIKNEVLR